MEDEMMHDDRNDMLADFKVDQLDQVDIEMDQVDKMTEITCWPTPAWQLQMLGVDSVTIASTLLTGLLHS